MKKLHDKTCIICSKEYMGSHNSIVCSPECFTKKRIRSKFMGGTEGIDFIMCPVCNEPAKEISNLHAKMHGFNSPKELALHYNMPYTKCEKIRNNMKGSNNPGFQHGGKLSPWSDKSEVHSKEQIQEAKEKAAENGLRKDYNRPSMKEYWIKKGQSEQEAKESARIHNLRDKAWFIRKYGEDLGHIKWVERQEKWYESLKKSGLFSGISKISRELFDAVQLRHDGKLFYGSEERTIRTPRRVYQVDLYDNNKNIIEFFGDYWHGNPDIFSDSHIIKKNKNGTVMTVADKREYDAQKIKDLESAGYSVKIVWERDYKDNPDKMVKECLEFLGGQSVSV